MVRETVMVEDCRETGRPCMVSGSKSAKTGGGHGRSQNFLFAGLANVEAINPKID
jgi:hypothetical protein